MMRALGILVLALSLGLTASAAPRDPEAQYYANAYADHYGVPRQLVYAIIEQESGWDHTAVSTVGAQGLMQLMPGTAWRFGVRNPFSRSDNIGGGVRYLKTLLDQFHGDMRLAVAAYYTGEDRVHRWGLHLSNPQVVSYVEQVRRRYSRELKLHPIAPPEGQQ